MMLRRTANERVFDRIFGIAHFEAMPVDELAAYLLARDMSGEALCARGHHLLGTVSDGLVGLTSADPDRVRGAVVALILAEDSPKRRALIDALVQSDAEEVAQVEELLRVSVAGIEEHSWELVTREVAMELAGIT